MEAQSAARELAWIRDRLAAPFPQGLDAAVIATNFAGQVAFWNEAAETLYGWRAEEALGRDILDLTPASYTRGQAEGIMASLRSGQSWGGEIVLRRRDGAALVAFVFDVPIGDLATDQGVIVGVSCALAGRAQLEPRLAEIETLVRGRFEA